MDLEINELPKKKNFKLMLKIISIVLVSLEMIFFTSEEGLDLGFSHPTLFNRKLLNALLIIFGNILVGAAVLFIILFRVIMVMIFGSIIYLILGLVLFIYLLIERYGTTSIEARPKNYYVYHIKVYTQILYYSSGVLLIVGSIIVFLYANILRNEQELRDKKEQFFRDNYLIARNDDDLKDFTD